MKKKNGFSLMEAMTVLLIVSVIAAASAPMINKKMISAASDKSPWVWVGDKNIAYNLKNADQTASIGATSPNTVARFHISTDNDKPQISLGYKNSNDWRLFAKGSSLNLSTSKNTPSLSVLIGKINSNSNLDDSSSNITAIGSSVTPADNSVVVGSSAQAGTSGVAVGSSAQAGSSGVAVGHYAKIIEGQNSIVIGAGNTFEKQTILVKGDNSIAIGYNSRVGTENGHKVDNAIALGPLTKAIGQNSIAIGSNVEAKNNNDFVLGNKDHRVKIPGEVYFKNKVIIPLEDITFEQNYKYYKFEQAQDGTLKLKEVNFKDAENIGSLTGTETITNSNKNK